MKAIVSSTNKPRLLPLALTQCNPHFETVIYTAIAFDKGSQKRNFISSGGSKPVQRLIENKVPGHISNNRDHYEKSTSKVATHIRMKICDECLKVSA